MSTSNGDYMSTSNGDYFPGMSGTLAVFPGHKWQIGARDRAGQEVSKREWVCRVADDRRAMSPCREVSALGSR